MYAIISLLLGCIVAAFVFLFLRSTFKTFGIYHKNKVVTGMHIVLSILTGILCSNVWSVEIVIILYLMLVTIILKIVSMALYYAFFKNSKKKEQFLKFDKIRTSGIEAAVCTLLIILYGVINMQSAKQTDYVVDTGKDVGEYKVVLITDTHYGTIQNPDVLKKAIDRINDLHPDVVILGGDIVEEDTGKDEMEEVFSMLGAIQSSKGIYYVYGNHDRQPYSNSRTYQNDELVNAITGNGIIILEDSYVEIGEDLIIAGRADAAWGNNSNRASVERILEDADRERFIIMADHQPIHVEENIQAGVDLEVSGHTHGGQIWPVGILTELTGSLNYGQYDYENFTAIVSSGLTGWGYPIRTEKSCEYVVISIKSTTHHLD